MRVFGDVRLERFPRRSLHRVDPDQKQMWKLAARYGAVGLELAIAVLMGYLLGRWLDEKAGTEPYLMILFVLIGVGAGVKGLIRVVKTTDFDKL
jgi:ATP synthase protein I